MYSYVSEELPALIFEGFPADATRQGIFGHSMGGHGAPRPGLAQPGALPLGLRVRSDRLSLGGAVGAQGIRGLSRAPSARAGAEYDATLLLPDRGWDRPILIDQGDADPFLEEQLRTGTLRGGVPATQVWSSSCASSRATTTATTSSPRSSETTSHTTPAS